MAAQVRLPCSQRATFDDFLFGFAVKGQLSGDLAGETAFTAPAKTVRLSDVIASSLPIVGSLASLAAAAAEPTLVSVFVTPPDQSSTWCLGDKHKPFSFGRGEQIDAKDEKVSDSALDRILISAGLVAPDSLEDFYASLASLLAFPAPRNASDRALLRSALTLNGCMCVYGFSFGLVFPIAIPHLVANYSELAGDETSAYGRFQSVFGLAQMVGSLYTGAVVDRHDPKYALLLTLLLGSAGSYALVALSSGIGGLYLAQVPGVFMMTLLVGQAAVTKYVAGMSVASGETNPDSRGTCEDGERHSAGPAMGRLFVYNGIGYAIGTALGGHLIGDLGNHGVAVLAGVISAGAAAFAWVGIEDSAETASSVSDDASSSGRAYGEPEAGPAVEPFQCPVCGDMVQQ